MDRRQAAEFLGVSVRTLERLAADGRIAKGRILRKTRPAVDFADEDLSRLKTELANEPSRRVIPEHRQSDTIGFRLDPLYVRRLTLLAEAHGMSPGEYARHIVVQTLEGERDDLILGEISGLKEALAQACVLFMTSKKAPSKDEAERIVKEMVFASGADRC